MASGGSNIVTVTGADSTAPFISVRLAHRDMKAVVVMEHEVDSMANIAVSENFGFMGLAFGAAVTLGATLVTVPTLQGTGRAIFYGLLLASVGLGVLFWRQAVRDKKKAMRVVETVKAAMTDLVVSAEVK